MWRTEERIIFATFALCTTGGVFTLPDEIYGASVHWRPTGTNSISLSYRLIWNRGLCGSHGHWSGDACYRYPFLTGKTAVTGVRSYFKGYKWQFTTGTVTGNANLSDLYFTDIGVFHEIAYETGVGITQHVLDPNADTANIRLSFLDSTDTLIDGLGEGHLSMAIRNDTQRANISPLLNVFPVSRVPLGCSSVIQLFPFDGDGDYVKCHWVKFPLKNEKEIHTVLNELMVYIGNATNPGECDRGPKFTSKGTLKPHFKHSYMLPFTETLVKLPFETHSGTDRILTTGPRYMIFQQKRNATMREVGTWNNLTDPTMKGIHQACGTAYTAEGIPGESRCAVLMMNDQDECQSNPCTREPGGICDNLFEYYTCTYPDDPTYDGSKWTGACEPETIVEKADDNLGVRVGVPVGLSLLLLLIVVGVTMYLKRYWTEKLKNSVVEPETEVNGIAKGVTEKFNSTAFV